MKEYRDNLTVFEVQPWWVSSQLSSAKKQQISTKRRTNEIKNTLKQIICRCCFYFTHIFEDSRFEVLISRFFWALFFKNSRFECDGGWKVYWVFPTFLRKLGKLAWIWCTLTTYIQVVAMVLFVYLVIFLRKYNLSLYLIVMLVEEKFNSKLFNLIW